MKEESAARLAEKKDKAQQELVSYKIDKLTEKVEKHNNVVENVAILQHDMSTVWMRYDDMKKLIDSIKKRKNNNKGKERFLLNLYKFSFNGSFFY